MALTRCPASWSAGTSRLPTKPVAPVTSTVRSVVTSTPSRSDRLERAKDGASRTGAAHERALRRRGVAVVAADPGHVVDPLLAAVVQRRRLSRQRLGHLVAAQQRPVTRRRAEHLAGVATGVRLRHRLTTG